MMTEYQIIIVEMNRKSFTNSAGQNNHSDVISRIFIEYVEEVVNIMNARMRQNQEDQQYYYDQQPPNLMVVGTAHAHYRRHMNAQAHQQQREPSWNNYAVANAPPAIIQRNLDAPAPMFGVAVNEPQVQRNGDDSNDSTDREEIYDAEQQRQEALRDLVADPEAQPNFAPVEAQAVDLDMLEEEGEDDEVMEVGGVDGQFMMDGRAVME